ncbi:hypothetical protein LXL04_006038 [Taraxacum kok-saghyz]
MNEELDREVGLVKPINKQDGCEYSKLSVSRETPKKLFDRDESGWKSTRHNSRLHFRGQRFHNVAESAKSLSRSSNRTKLWRNEMNGITYIYDDDDVDTAELIFIISYLWCTCILVLEDDDLRTYYSFMFWRWSWCRFFMAIRDDKLIFRDAAEEDGSYENTRGGSGLPEFAGCFVEKKGTESKAFPLSSVNKPCLSSNPSSIGRQRSEDPTSPLSPFFLHRRCAQTNQDPKLHPSSLLPSNPSPHSRKSPSAALLRLPKLHLSRTPKTVGNGERGADDSRRTTSIW